MIEVCADTPINTDRESNAGSILDVGQRKNTSVNYSINIVDVVKSSLNKERTTTNRRYRKSSIC